MAAFFIWHHMGRSYGIVLPQIRGVEIGGVGMYTYKVLFPRILESVGCLVEGKGK